MNTEYLRRTVNSLAPGLKVFLVRWAAYGVSRYWISDVRVWEFLKSGNLPRPIEEDPDDSQNLKDNYRFGFFEEALGKRLSGPQRKTLQYLAASAACEFLSCLKKEKTLSDTQDETVATTFDSDMSTHTVRGLEFASKALAVRSCKTVRSLNYEQTLMEEWINNRMAATRLAAYQRACLEDRLPWRMPSLKKCHEDVAVHADKVKSGLATILEVPVSVLKLEQN